MKKAVLVLNFSGAYLAQGFVSWLEAEGAEKVLADASEIEGTCCYCDREARARIGALLSAELPGLRWLDSGDYHYVSYLLAMRERKPFHLLLMDHHPDDQAPAFGEEVLSCGSWVKALKEESRWLRSVLSIGPEENPEENEEEAGPDSAAEEGCRPGWRSGEGSGYVCRWTRTSWTVGGPGQTGRREHTAWSGWKACCGWCWKAGWSWRP